jgi:predicted transcriptional regulator
MTRKNQPQTSKDAYNNLQPEKLREDYQKILKALERLGTASSEQIAAYLTVEHSVVHKRTSELMKMGLIFRPGHRVPTKRGATAFVWCLCSAGVKTDNENKKLEGPSVVDYSKTISDIQSKMW